MVKRRKIIRTSGKFQITQASPDDPIYTRGFFIGGRRSRKSSNSSLESAFSKAAEEVRRKYRESGTHYTQEEFDKDLDDLVNKQLPREFREQMGAEPMSEKTEQSCDTKGDESMEKKH